MEQPSLRLTRSVTEVQIPASVQAILANRIDRLGPEQRRLLQVAAVIGKEVPRDILAAVADLAESLLSTYLAELQAAEFIYEINRVGGTDYTFKHALTQTVAYVGMLRRQRRELHGRVLTVMESRAADRADELTELLADHALRGEVWNRAADLAARAGKRANLRSAWHEAITFHEQAMQALAKLPEGPDTLAQGIDVRLGMRVALGPTMQITRVLEMVDQASELAERLGDFTRMAQIDVSRCIFLSIMGSLDRAVEVGRSAQRVARSLGDPASRVNAAYALGQTLWFRGDFAGSAEVMGEALPLVRGAMRLHNTGTTGTASVLLLVCLSKTHAMTGAFDEAFACAEEAHAIAEETSKPYDITYAHLATGFAHLQRSEPDLAVAALEAALSCCRSAGIGLLVPSVARYLGRAYAMTGRLAEARMLMTEAMTATASPSLMLLTVWCGLASGHVHGAAGDHEDAIEQLEASLALARAHGYRPAETLALRLLAEIHAAQGRREAARAHADSSLTLAAELGMHPDRQALERLRTLLADASDG